MGVVVTQVLQIVCGEATEAVHSTRDVRLIAFFMAIILVVWCGLAVDTMGITPVLPYVKVEPQGLTAQAVVQALMDSMVLRAEPRACQ